MKSYKFNSKMAEISGLGGSYERACRQMVRAGLKWLDEHPEAEFSFLKSKYFYGVIKGGTDDTKELIDVMAKAPKPDLGVTGAMVQATVQTVMWIQHHSWGEYVQHMTEAKSKKGTR